MMAETAAEPPPDAWDEADEESLVARVQGTQLQEDPDKEVEIRWRDAVLLRETEALVTRAMAVPNERKMLLKLDDQFEKFMSNRELQNIKINGVSEKQVTLIKAVAVFFRLRTMQVENSISILKTDESIVPSSRFGEPRDIAGATAHLARSLRCSSAPCAACRALVNCFDCVHNARPRASSAVQSHASSRLQARRSATRAEGCSHEPNGRRRVPCACASEEGVMIMRKPEP